MNNDGTAASPLLLDRYRVEGILGAGGLGSVVSAFDTRLQRKVAIKTLKPPLGPVDPVRLRNIEDRFSREAIAGSRMGSHPNLVAVYDTVAGPNDTLYLIMEYVAGGTLDHRLRTSGTIPLNDALRLTADIARGLLAAHEVGLVHRDIKPANIFLAADGRAQVGDFGIAQIDDVSGRTQVTASHPGTPLYMSPEQERTTGYLRPNTDQYGLGLVLFEMLTGKMYKRLSAREADDLLSAMPRPVAALIERLTAENPEDRYPDMARVVAAVQAITNSPYTTGSGSSASYNQPPGFPSRVPGPQATVLEPPPSYPPVSSPYASGPYGAQTPSSHPSNPSPATPPPPYVSGPSFPAPSPNPAPPTAPAPRRVGRRYALFAIGGVVAAGAAGGGYLLLAPKAATAPTATPPSPGTAAAATVVGGTGATPNPSILPTATVIPATPTETPRPTATPGPTSTPILPKFSTRVVTDALDHPEQWQMDKIPNQSIRTLDKGFYSVQVTKKPDGSGLFSWGDWVPPAGVRGTAFIAEVEMRLQGDPPGAAGGFVFLYNYVSDALKHQFLSFQIRADRRFSVTQQLPGGEGHEQKFIDWAQHPAIVQGVGAVNLMRIEVRQGKFSCFANNQPVYLDQVVPNEVAQFSALSFAANVLRSSVEPTATATFSNFRYENLSQ